MKVGKILQRIRKAKKYSQTDIAVSSDMSSATLSGIENDNQACSLEQLRLICVALGVPPSYVIFEAEGSGTRNYPRGMRGVIFDMMQRSRNKLEVEENAISNT